MTRKREKIKLFPNIKGERVEIDAQDNWSGQFMDIQIPKRMFKWKIRGQGIGRVENWLLEELDDHDAVTKLQKLERKLRKKK